MKLARIQIADAVCYGEVRDDKVYLISGDIFGKFKVTAKEYSLDEVKLLAPVVPEKIIGIGLNYLSHIGEFYKNPQIPEEPVIFMVSPSAVIGPGEEITIPYPDHETHYEAELAVVMGAEGRNIPEEKAAEYILGYTCGNDVSDRAIQKIDRQWTRAKSFHTFKPLGPVIATDINPLSCAVRSRVNGELKQNGNTCDMIKNAYYLVSFISQVMTLKPGDIILTGTPDGVGPLKPHDICEIEIEGIGILRNPVTAAK